VLAMVDGDAVLNAAEPEAEVVEREDVTME
jgi:hypothetical protein